jgi:hypothetical protein
MPNLPLAPVAVVTLMLVSASVLLLWPWPQADRVTRENFSRLEEGMSRADVDAILGPLGDYRTGDTNLALSGPTVFGQSGRSQAYTWRGDTANIKVGFDPSGHLFAASYQAMRRSENPIDNILFRAFRLWSRWFS